MKEKIFYSALFLTAILFYTANAYAFGIGAYFTASTGSYEWEYNIDEQEDPIIDSGVRKPGFGFMLDTNLARDQIYNYRLQVGYSKITIDNDHNAYDLNGKEYHIYNTFGFGIIREKFGRLWFGPQIGAGYIDGEYDMPSSLEYEGNYFWTLYFSTGFVAGFNYNLGDFFTLAVDGGIRVLAGFGTADMASSTIGVQVTGTEGFINVCALLRLNDNYGR
ncbi:MAG: hypothetical protein JW864_13860 [Spirochaetes bacterium]|nr:hypothetical protein [Spirochaetota bacterium]